MKNNRRKKPGVAVRTHLTDRHPLFVKFREDMSGASRVETGMLQFPKDRPGLFIRGDDAIVIMCELRSVFEVLHDSVSHMDKLTGGCASLSKLPQLAELIDKHVKGRKLPVRKGYVRNQSFRSDRKFTW